MKKINYITPSKDPGCYKMVSGISSIVCSSTNMVCDLCIFPPLCYMIEVYMGSLGLTTGICPWIVNRLCPQCNPIAELIHKIYG